MAGSINTADNKAFCVIDIHRLGHFDGVPAGLDKHVAVALQALYINTVSAAIDRQLAAALNRQVIVAFDRGHRQIRVHVQGGVTHQDYTLIGSNAACIYQAGNILSEYRHSDRRNKSDHQQQCQHQTKDAF